MGDRRLKILTIGVIILAAISRLVYLGVFPPGGFNSFWLRVPTAVAGTSSIMLLMWLVQRISRNKLLSLVSGFMLTIMPWHIEQSRVYSQAMIGLTVLLLGAIIYTATRMKLLKIIVAVVTGLGFYFVYPQFWIFKLNFKLPIFNDYLGNLFKLVSVEFLFYKNDSFWSGGFRTWGVFLPSFIPIIIVGMLSVFEKIKVRHWNYVLLAAVIWFLSGANPTFPEGREYLLITPYLAVISAFGVIKVFGQFKSSNIILRTLIIALLLFVIYEYALFTHFYTTHYSQRIENEIPHEEIAF